MDSRFLISGLLLNLGGFFVQSELSAIGPSSWQLLGLMNLSVWIFLGFLLAGLASVLYGLTRMGSMTSKHYRIQKTTFLPTPVQKPRIPIWVGGFWPRKAPFRRAAKWDGVIPLKLPEELLEPEDLREITSYVRKRHPAKAKFDFVNIGWTTGKNRERNRQKVAPFIEAGMTWWLEGLYTQRDLPGEMRRRIRLGPPRNTNAREKLLT